MEESFHWIMEGSWPCLNMWSRACLCFFHSKKIKLSGCLSIWCSVSNRGMLECWPWWYCGCLSPQSSWSEKYWTFVPDHLILHADVGEGKEIIVMVNDVWLLDRPDVPISHTFVCFNYSRSRRGMPTGCLAILSPLCLGTWRSHLPVYCSSVVTIIS